MEELREIAKAHYRAGSKEIQAAADNFFKSIDTDGDGWVDLPEFLSFTKMKNYSQMQNPHFFKLLDGDGDGRLDFPEAMTLYYIIKSGRPFCDNCGHFILGIYFSCFECYTSTSSAQSSNFNLCRDCYISAKCKHSHDGIKTQFLDNYTLLEALQKDPALAKKQKQARISEANVPKPRPSPSPNSSTAIVPAAAPKPYGEIWTLVAYKAVETIGHIARSCTIL